MKSWICLFAKLPQVGIAYINYTSEFESMREIVQMHALS